MFLNTVTNSVSNGAVMKDYLSILIPASVTVTGFIVTYFMTKRNFKEQLQKEKISIHLEEMSKMPYEILKLMDTIIDTSKNQNKKNQLKQILSDFQSTMSKLYAYGTLDTIKILSTMQEENYLTIDTVERDNYRIMAYYVILATQIKYDTTGMEISPDFWYRMRLTDYKNNKEQIVHANNKIVNELGLDKFLRI